MFDVRVDHGAQRVLLQVRELREHERVCVGSSKQNWRPNTRQGH